MNAGLWRLALARALAPAVLLSWAALLILLLPQEWAGANALREAAALAPAALAGGDASALARGLAREGIWTILCLTIVPCLVARAGRAVPLWRAGEGDWLGSRPVGRGRILFSTWLGTWSGAAALAALSLIAIEVAVGLKIGPAGPGLARAGEIALPPATWIEARAPLSWSAPDPGDRAPAGSRARVELGFGAVGGSAAEVVFRARRSTSEFGERISRARIASRGAVEVELPAGNGELRFELSCELPGARAFVISDAAELWVPCASDRAASAGILARLVLALAAWTALALGLGAWVSTPIAALLLLAAWIPLWLGDRAAAWMPGCDLWDALEIAGTGRVPSPVDIRSLPIALLMVAFGLALGATGLSSWRRAP